MALSLSDLTTPLTTDEVKEKIYDVLATVGVNTTTWKPGAVVRTLITAFAILFASLSSLVALVAAGGFLETAKGAWLTLVARYVYGVERDLATYALGEITLTNTAGGVFAPDADDIIFTNPDTGKTYRNVQAFTLAALEVKTISIVAVESGSGSSSLPGTIVAFETEMLGVTCSNESALVGLDDETDPSLKARCGEKLGSLSPNGPWDAYSYVARAAKLPDGTPIGITRTAISRDGYGNLDLYVATATGALSGSVVDPESALGAVSLAVQRSAVPLAVTANVLSASEESVDITYQVWLYNTSGRNEEEVIEAIGLSLVAFLAVEPIGGRVISGAGEIYISSIQNAISSTFDSGIVIKVAVTLPVTDHVMPAYAVPVLGTVTPTVTFVSAPEGY